MKIINQIILIMQAIGFLIIENYFPLFEKIDLFVIIYIIISHFRFVNIWCWAPQRPKKD